MGDPDSWPRGGQPAEAFVRDVAHFRSYGPGLRDLMREWCNCGSGIRALSPRRIDAWRRDHRHSAQDSSEPEKSGASADVWHAGGRYFESESLGLDVPIVNAKHVGFRAE